MQVEARQSVRSGVELLRRAGVELVLVGDDQVVLAPYGRNVERAAKALRDVGAELRLIEGTERLDVVATAEVLRASRTAWQTPDGPVDVDLEPVPGLRYSELVLDAPPAKPGDQGPPCCCDEHRDQIAAVRRGDRAAAGPRRAAYVDLPAFRRPRRR